MFDISLFIIGQSHPKLEAKFKNKFKAVHIYKYFELFHNEILSNNFTELADCVFLPDLNFFNDFFNQSENFK